MGQNPRPVEYLDGAGPVRLALVLLQHCRPTDIVCRYGGDEFCVVVPDTTEAGAAFLAERLCGELEACVVDFNGQPLTLTSSFGVAQIAESMHHADCLVDLADQALLAAKQAGRNRVMRASHLESSHEDRQLADMATAGRDRA